MTQSSHDEPADKGEQYINALVTLLVVWVFIFLCGWFLYVMWTLV